MKKKIISLICSILCVCLLAGCQCEHEWSEATCTEAKTCSLCGEIEGEALSHDWMEANCENPKTCGRCGLTEGDALGHTLGEWTETLDYNEAKTLRDQFCTTCSALLNSEIVPIEDVVKNGKFIFTPREFTERFVYLASDRMENISYSAIEGDEFFVGIKLGDKRVAAFKFYDSDMNSLAKSDFDNANVCKIYFYYTFQHGPLTWAPEMDEFPDFDVLILGDIFAEIFIKTCEPVIPDKAAYYFQSVGVSVWEGSEEWVQNGDTYLLATSDVEYYISPGNSNNDDTFVEIIASALPE